MSRSDDLVLMHVTFWLLVLIALGTLVGLVTYGVDKVLHGLYVEGGIALFGTVGIFLTYHSMGSRLRRRIREVRREEAAAHGQSMALLARPQPEPMSETSIGTPIMIRLRLDWRSLASFMVMMLAILAFFAWAINSAGGGVYGEDYWKSGVGLFQLLCLLAATIGLFVFFIWYYRQELIAGDTGISLKQGFSTTTIRWSAARLFAVTGTYTPAPDLIHYSLDGNGASIRWSLYTKPPRWMMLQPVAPFEDYDRQMRALLSLVVAKTGLPLLDAK